MRKLVFLFTLLCFVTAMHAQNIMNNPGSNHGNKFEQLGTILPSPNEYRTASGAPGPKYWQQRADYNIKCELDEPNLLLKGSETVTYYNNSPDILTYIWLQLDENQHSTVNNANYQNSSTLPRQLSTGQLEQMEGQKMDNGYGEIISKCTDGTGKALKYFINKTMMRIDLPAPLKSGQQFVFNIDWSNKIPNKILGGRGGYEIFF